jgi:hypothetical protein
METGLWKLLSLTERTRSWVVWHCVFASQNCMEYVGVQGSCCENFMTVAAEHIPMSFWFWIG